MKPKLFAAAALAGALAVAALGVRGLRPAPQAADVPLAAPSMSSPQAAPAAPVQAAVQAQTQAQAQPQTQSLPAAPDLSKADVVEEVVAPQQPAQPAAPQAKQAPRPRLQALHGVSNVMDVDAHTGAMIAAGPDQCPTCAAAQNEMMKAVQAMTGQAQALAAQASSPKGIGAVKTAAHAPEAMDTPQAIALALSPSSTLEDIRYVVTNLNDKTVNDVQIITPEKTWKLGSMKPGQTAEIVAGGPLMQVKVHYVTSPK